MTVVAQRETTSTGALRARPVALWQMWESFYQKVPVGWLLLAIFVALGLAFSTSCALAQGCAMCYQTAASAGAAGRAALRHGILILLVPALTLFVAVLALIWSRRNPASRLRDQVSSGSGSPRAE